MSGSVSEGMKKYGTKNYYVRLVSLETRTTIMETNKGVKIQPWTKVSELKSKVGKHYGVSNKNIRLFYCNTEMLDDSTMLDYQMIDQKNSEILFKISSTDENEINIQVYAAFPCPNVLRNLINEIRHGFLVGLVPTLIFDGTSGTYNLRNTNKDTVALFKPIDEEAFAPNNLKGYTGKFGQESFRKGILSGEGSIREVAAFLLDRTNFFHVPETTFVEITHPTFNRNANELLSIENNSLPKMKHSIIHKFLIENLVSTGILLNRKTGEGGTEFNTEKKSNSEQNTETSSSKYNYIRKKYGSLQRFVKSNDVAANFASSLFSVKSVHKIGVLDIRILNCDRNDENILVIKKRLGTTGNFCYKLIPIDHSLSFPDCIKIQEYEMCWMGWSQAHEPFSKEMLNYIKKIDILAEMNRMRQIIKLRDKCWKNFRISNIVLKIGAEMGLNLFNIGMLLYKPGFEEEVPSVVETLIEKTEKLCSLYCNIHRNTLTNIFFTTTDKNKDYDKDEEAPNSIFLDSNSGSFKTECDSHNLEEDLKEEMNKISITNCGSLQSVFIKEIKDKDKDSISFNIAEYNCCNPNESIKIAPELIEDTFTKRNTKKRGSLLKRTASEPQLSILDSNSESKDNSCNNNKNEENFTTDYASLNSPKITKLQEKANKKSYKEKLLNNNSKNSESEQGEDGDSPYNEIFFYNFENVLVEYLQKNYKK